MARTRLHAFKMLFVGLTSNLLLLLLTIREDNEEQVRRADDLKLSSFRRRKQLTAAGYRKEARDRVTNRASCALRA